MLPRTHALRSALLAIIVSAVLLGACTAQTAAPVPTSTPVTDLGLQLSWIHEYSSSPFYAAEKNGHFAAEGLRVRFAEGGFNDQGSIDPISQVLSGAVDIGLSNASTLIRARADGKPVVAIGNVFQRSPLAVISLKEANLARPQDLVGRTVLVADDGTDDVLRAMLRSQQIDPATVDIRPRTSYGVEPLLTNEADAIVAWVINEGVQVREAGKEPSFMLISDYGIDSYDFVVFTSEETISKRSAAIAGFMRALNHGIADVIANPDQAIDYTLAYSPALDRPGQLRRLEASLPLIRPANTQIGAIDAEVWKLTQQVLLDEGILTAPIDLERVFTTAFVSP